MSKVQLTPAELLSQGNEMEALKLQYEQLFQGVEGILNNTNANWSANLSNNFTDKIKAAQNSLRKIVEMLQFGAVAATSSANSFESIDSQLCKLMRGMNGTSGAVTDATAMREVEISGVSSSIFDITKDDKEDAVRLFKWIEKAAGIYGTFANEIYKKIGEESEAIWDSILSPISWLLDVDELYEKALDGNVELKELIDLFGDGMGASGDVLSLIEKWMKMKEHSLNTGFLNNLKTLTKIFDLGIDEYKALVDGTYEGFLEHVDDIIGDIGAITLGVGKAAGLVGKGLTNFLKANELITVFKGMASFVTHTGVGLADAYTDDGRIDWQEIADISLDAGTHGGCALLSGVTLGLVNVDADTAIDRFKQNSDDVTNIVCNNVNSLGGQIVANIALSPLVFVGTTAELIMETQPAKILGQGAEFLEGKIHSGLEKLFGL